MTDFRQLCPACKKTLELPVASIGKLAQCPLCEVTFTAGEAPSATTSTATEATEPEHQNAPTHSSTQTRDQEPQPDPPSAQAPAEATSSPTDTEGPSTPTAEKQPIDAETPEPDPIASSSAEEQETLNAEWLSPSEATPASPSEPVPSQEPAKESVVPAPVYPEGINPFSQPLMQASVAPVLYSPYVNANETPQPNFAVRSEVTIVNCSASDLFKTTWAIMLDRGFTLIASLLVLIFIAASTYIMVLIFTWILSMFFTEQIIVIVWYVALALSASLAIVFLCRSAIGVARRTPHLMSDSSITFRSWIHALVPIALLTTATVFFKWILLDGYFLDLTVVIVIGLCTIGTLGWLWSSLFLCCDLQCSGFKSLLIATKIVYHNKLTTLALLSASTFLILIGLGSYGILLIVILPFVQLLLAASYLKMTNQPFADPREILIDN